MYAIVVDRVFDFAELIKNWHAANGKVSVDEFSKLTNLQHRLQEGAKPFLPSLLVMCGSNFLFIMVSTRMRQCNFLFIMVSTLPAVQ